MTYRPHRDNRFEYVWDVMSFIEERQCETCAFKSDREDYAMCGEVEAELMSELSVEGLDDVGDDGVVCTLYRDETLEAESVNQSTLF